MNNPKLNPNSFSLPRNTGNRNMEFNYVPSVNSRNLSLSVTVLLFLCLFCRSRCFDEEQVSFNTFTVSSFTYPQTTIRAYDLRYIRVELPPWFSSMSLALRSDVDLGTVKLENVPKSRLPIICFRYGSPPLTDSNGSLTDSGRSVLFPNFNTSVEGIEALRNGEQCYPMQKNVTVTLTNEQISPGVWYFGLFNGIGQTRTQSKMIIRGPSYSFSANITVNGCTTSTMWGQYCNQTIESLSCAPANTFSSSLNLSDSLSYNRTKNYISCKGSFGTSCHWNGEPKFYTLDIAGLAEELRITAGNFSGGDSLTCIVRHGAIPFPALHDFSGNIGKGPLVIRSPKTGRWYFTFLPRHLSDHNRVCYAVESNLLQCPLGKSGPNCSWEKHVLRTVIRKSSAPFESYYFPVGAKSTSKDSSNFLLEPLLTNTSRSEESSNNTWTYFIVDIPRGAAGGNIRVRLLSDTKTIPEIYARHGGYPSADIWDYYYVNETRNSAGSLFFKVYNSSEERVDFDILSIKEGAWGFGLRVSNGSKIGSRDPTVMSISLERCPRGCSHPHGECKLALDTTGLALYSYCSCDRNHGGFDCSVEIVSHEGHIWQSISLIASNAAAILPAFWALRQKALAEWVIYTSSGVSSGLYHACDVGSGCALSFNALQFLDFWLSFMAVVSTFVYLATIKEAYKRAIHAAVAILTAVMAITKATRSSNIILVIAIGSCGLLVGLLVEYSTKLRSFSLLIGVCFNTLQRWEAVKGWAQNAVKTMLRRFRWGFVLAGFTALAMAAISWNLESSESYWIWHSIWHVTIYTSSFFFLCSKSKVDNNNDDPSLPDRTYELTRQDSAPRGN